MTAFRSLDLIRIEQTIRVLNDRIHERFPQSGLGSVCTELLAIIKVAERRCADISRPHIGLRILVYIPILLIIAGLFAALFSLNLSAASFLNLTEFVQVLEAGMNAVVLIGAAVLFLVTVENRLKRQRALRAVHELRAIAHVIDMHQLTKDPERILTHWHGTTSSPRETLNAFQLTRYLDYCTEMLSLLGKIAALYAQDFDDSIVLSSANELEILTTGLSQKIWQKINIVHSLEKRTATVD